MHWRAFARPLLTRAQNWEMFLISPAAVGNKTPSHPLHLLTQNLGCTNQSQRRSYARKGCVSELVRCLCINIHPVVRSGLPSATPVQSVLAAQFGRVMFE
jgi:hypothetical protein